MQESALAFEHNHAFTERITPHDLGVVRVTRLKNLRTKKTKTNKKHQKTTKM